MGEVLTVFSPLQIRMWASLTHQRHIVKAKVLSGAHALSCTWQAIPVPIQHHQMAATITTKCNTPSVLNLTISIVHMMTPPTHELTQQVLLMPRVSSWHALIESSATRSCVSDLPQTHQCNANALQMQHPLSKSQHPTFLVKTTSEVLTVFSQ